MLTFNEAKRSLHLMSKLTRNIETYMLEESSINNNDSILAYKGCPVESFKHFDKIGESFRVCQWVICSIEPEIALGFGYQSFIIVNIPKGCFNACKIDNPVG